MSDVIHRFAIVGDVHMDIANYEGAEPPDFSDRFSLLLGHLKDEEQTGLDFVHFNGDLIQGAHYPDRVAGLQEFKDLVTAEINTPIYAAYGNHDHTDDAGWTQVFGHNRSHAFEIGNYGFIILNSSDTSGARQVCRDESFLINKLNEYANKKGVFLFIHVPRFPGFRSGDFDSPECPGINDAIEQAENVISVTHSHFHNQIDTVDRNGVQYWFTGHVAHYGVPWYGYRVVEIYEDGSGETRLYNFSDDRVENDYIFGNRAPNVFRHKRHEQNHFTIFKTRFGVPGKKL